MVVVTAVAVILVFCYSVMRYTRREFTDRIDLLSERFLTETSGLSDDESREIRHQFNVQTSLVVLMGFLNSIMWTVTALTLIVAAEAIINHLFN